MASTTGGFRGLAVRGAKSIFTKSKRAIENRPGDNVRPISSSDPPYAGTLLLRANPDSTGVFLT